MIINSYLLEKDIQNYWNPRFELHNKMAFFYVLENNKEWFNEEFSQAKYTLLNEIQFNYDEFFGKPINNELHRLMNNELMKKIHTYEMENRCNVQEMFFVMASCGKWEQPIVKIFK